MVLVERYTLVSLVIFINIDIGVTGEADKALLLTPASLLYILIGFIMNTIL